jgi:hypothetical protein
MSASSSLVAWRYTNETFRIQPLSHVASRRQRRNAGGFRRSANRTTCSIYGVLRLETRRVPFASYPRDYLDWCQATGGRGLRRGDYRTNGICTYLGAQGRSLIQTISDECGARDHSIGSCHSRPPKQRLSSSNTHLPRPNGQLLTRMLQLLLRVYTSSQWPPNQVARTLGCLQQREGLFVPSIVPHLRGKD